MNITILWASGRTGKQLIEQWLARGHKITALVRHPEKLAEYEQLIQIISGSAIDKNDVQKAIIWADIVIDTVSVPLLHRRPTNLFSEVAQAVIDARSQAQAQRYIVMSSFGTQHGRKLSWPANRWYELFLGDVADDKEKEEALLEASKLPWTVVKAVLLDDGIIWNYNLSPFADFKPSIWKHITRSTVAKAILDIAENGSYMREKVVVE